MRHFPIEAIAIVVPARNEQALIAHCLAALECARAHLDRVDHPDHGRVRGHTTRVRTLTVVVDDDSIDDTAAVAARFTGVSVVRSGGENVGRARAIGIDFALTTLGLDPRRVWIANTDADSTVPEHWLAEQVRLADAGADAVIGTVRPARADLSAEELRAWRAAHEPTDASADDLPPDDTPPGDTPGLIYGANLGVRGDSYLRVGRFAPLPEHEDVDLVERLNKGGANIAWSRSIEVVTSGRKFGRTPGGFAGYLRTQLMKAEGVVR